MHIHFDANNRFIVHMVANPSVSINLSFTYSFVIEGSLSFGRTAGTPAGGSLSPLVAIPSIARIASLCLAFTYAAEVSESITLAFRDRSLQDPSSVKAHDRCP